jgi:hypothetical protein
VFPACDEPWECECVTVFVDDVTKVDARSMTLAKTALGSLRSGRGKPVELPFRINVDRFDKRARYTIRAHASVAGIDDVRQGDFVSVQSHLVLTHGQTNTARVPMHHIG